MSGPAVTRAFHPKVIPGPMVPIKNIKEVPHPSLRP